MKVYRVQDDVGRGPWRPGLSHRWVDPNKDDLHLLPWRMEFGDEPLRNLMSHEHIGCGCRTLEGLAAWFNDFETRNLEHLDYRVVMLDNARVLSESVIQVVFARALPLKFTDAILPWELLRKAGR